MTLGELISKSDKQVIGLMSGTSADGVDAVLVRIKGCGTSTEVLQEEYISIPFSDEVRSKILEIAKGENGGSKEICLLSARLGQLYLEACETLCEKAGISLKDIDLVGCHGQTVFHQPVPEYYLGETVTSTLQIGDPSILAEKMDTIVVSDFRVRDMAAGGQGAPLVPYSEYLIYRSEKENVALQNIGGIGNITFLPAAGELSDTIAFDTGPGNMLMDAMVSKMTGGTQRFDEGGKISGQYKVNKTLLESLMQDPYLTKVPPKTTGREYYGEQFLENCLQEARVLGVSEGDVLRTLTRYTAETIAYAVKNFLPQVPDCLIIGGGGSYNLTLLQEIQDCLPQVRVVTNEDLGFDSDAKEAVAFAVLANETVSGNANNVPTATGASHPVIMGKISQ